MTTQDQQKSNAKKTNPPKNTTNTTTLKSHAKQATNWGKEASNRDIHQLLNLGQFRTMKGNVKMQQFFWQIMAQIRPVVFHRETLDLELG